VDVSLKNKQELHMIRYLAQIVKAEMLRPNFQPVQTHQHPAAVGEDITKKALPFAAGTV
jgi:hypothetical protein